MAKKNLNKTSYSNKKLLDKIELLEHKLSVIETNGCTMCPFQIDYNMGEFRNILSQLMSHPSGFQLGEALRAFKALKNKLKKDANARKRTIAIDEYLKLLDVAPAHFKTVLIVAYNTGMRSGGTSETTMEVY